MKTAIFVCLILLLAAVLAQFFLAGRFLAEIARQEQSIRTAPAADLRDPAEIPDAMRRFAGRGLASQANPPRAVHLTQEAQVLQGETWSTSQTHQHIAIAEPAFVWVAHGAGWPVPAVRVMDRFTGGEGLLEVRLFGSIRVGQFTGPDADIGEAMRYLAELPLAPDAIVSNGSILWRQIDAQTVEAELALPPGSAVVRFHLDDAGDVVEVTADDRPDVSSGERVLRQWRGVFSDYEEIGGRRVPHMAEVGYVNDGVYTPYFRGRITSYEVLK